MLTDEQKKKKIRIRLRDDFAFWAEKCAKVKDKDKDEVVPFRLNHVQRRLLALMNEQMRLTGRVRIVILKARQQGASTFASAYFYFRLSQSKLKKGMVVAHHATPTNALFDMYKRFHDHMPVEPFNMKPQTANRSRRELTFAKLDSAISVATAGGEEIGRGETLAFAHLSEVAFWKPADKASANFAALMQAVPDADGTVVLAESTANGKSGKFYELWNSACDTPADLLKPGASPWLKFFSPWFDTPEYAEPVGSDEFELTIDEQLLRKEFPFLTDEQLCWRRSKTNEIGSRKFKVEYPASPDDAFDETGSPAFDPKAIGRMEERARDIHPIHHMGIDDSGKLVEVPNGLLRVYREYDPGEVYTIGADVALGDPNSQDRADFSAACVLDSQQRQVASFQAKIIPEDFGDFLDKVGRYYNNALIATEINNIGSHTARQLLARRYPNIYTDIDEKTLQPKHTLYPGFRTTPKSKESAVNDLATAIARDQIEVNCRATIAELKSYIVDNGKYKAAPGKHDDLVMALAIANKVLQRRAPLIPNTERFCFDPIG
jgi:hypothetical protein